MERVIAYARKIGAETIDDWLAGRKWSLELNQMMQESFRETYARPEMQQRFGQAPLTGLDKLERQLEQFLLGGR
jgi:hypothetical protein